MNKDKKNVSLLSACQGLLLTNNSILVATNALAGFSLATNKSLATLPVTGYIIGAALTTFPASLLMRKIGRRSGFILGALFGICGSLICGYAMYLHDFALLCVGTIVLGAYNAAGQYYRFAAADSVKFDFKSKAISLVLAGGIAGGILGPETSKLTKDFFSTAAFLGSYLSLGVFCLLAIVVLSFVDIPPLTAAQKKEPGRPLSEIVRQPAYIVAVLSATISYGVMNLLMTATPLAMMACNYPFNDAAFVIQWHVVAMFGPSLFTGSLIGRFGVINVMLIGVALNVMCVAVALAGVEVMNFWLAMVLLGVGWNFMFVGGTTLITECHAPSERAKAQGANDQAIFITMAATSVSSGLLFTLQGWETMNRWAIPFLIVSAAADLWLAARRRKAPRAVTR